MTGVLAWTVLAALLLTGSTARAGSAADGAGAPIPWLPGRRRAGADADAGLPLVLDLLAAALRSGRPLAEALRLAAPAGDPRSRATLGRVANLSLLGADAEQAWSGVPREGPLGELARVAVRSADSGLRLAAALERLAAEIRAEAAAAAAARAHRAGVHAMGPLAACFLPSFVCLGIVPVIAGVARGVFHALP